MKKRLLIASTATIVGLATATGAAFAATQANGNSQDTLVDKIAMRFNLNKADVQKVFDESHTEHESQRQSAIRNFFRQHSNRN